MSVKTITADTVIAWVDVETTGLSEHDYLLEVGVILTRGPEAEEIGRTSVLTKPTDHVPAQNIVDQMGEYVHTMHTDSGLIADYLAPDAQLLSYQDAAEHLNGFLDQALGEAGKPLMGGSSITFDRTVLTRTMPAFHDRLHYRSIDMTTVEYFASTILGQVPQVTDGVAHRALGDLEGDVRLFRAVRQALAG